VIRSVVRHLILLAFVVLLAGCVTTRNVTDGTRVPPGYGLVVFKAKTDMPWAQLHYTHFKSQMTLGSALAEEFFGPEGAFLIEQGEKYWVRPVKVGDYMWSKVAVSGRYALFDGTNRFTVNSGQITYIGHLTLDGTDGFSARITAADNEGDMVEYLKAHYPNYYASMSFTKSVTDFL